MVAAGDTWVSAHGAQMRPLLLVAATCSSASASRCHISSLSSVTQANLALLAASSERYFWASRSSSRILSRRAAFSRRTF
eukprot:11713015-Heterocapsa_arctica.AAC.1